METLIMPASTSLDTPKSKQHISEISNAVTQRVPTTFLGKSERKVFVGNGAVIVERIKDTRVPFYRPALPQQESAGVHPDILTLMKKCWAEEPFERPSFYEISKTLKTINKGKLVQCCFVLHSCNILLCSSLANKNENYPCLRHR